MKKIGVHTAPSPFEDFIGGRVNPFDDVNKHNPKGAGQFESINKNNNPGKRKLPDDTKISL